MKQLTGFLFFVCWAMLANAQSTSLLTQSVFFATDSYQLSPNEVQNLDVLVPQLDTYADYSIEIKAHTDNRGSNGYNQQLSERRADAVYQYLVQKGIKSTKTNSTALGENEPLYNNADAEGQQKNRRVDVLITTYLFDSLEQLLKRATQDNLQTFYIEPAQNRTITARNGTTIAIAAGSLTYHDGTTPTSTITLQLREALSTADILLENLNTVSNGQILETGGMVYLAAQANGKDLEVKSGSNLQISIPTTKVQNGMELFYGKQNANKTINWEPANVSFTQKTTPQNDALPPINFDFLKITVPLSSLPAQPTFATAMPPKLIKPTKPYLPIAPQPPKRARFKYQPKFPQSLFISKAKIKEIEEDRFRRKMKAHEKSNQMYQQRLARYEQSLKNYAQQDSVFAPQQQQWEAELQNRIDELNQFATQYANYEATQRLKTALPKWYEILPQLAKAVGTDYNKIDQLHNTIILSLLKETNKVKFDGVNFLLLNQMALGQEVMDDKKLLEEHKLQNSTQYRTNVNNQIVQLFDELCYAKIEELRQQVSEQLVKMGKFSTNSLNQYVSEVNTLGWINCDRFYSYPDADKVAITIAETSKSSIYAVCKDIKSMLPIYEKGGVYVSDKLPKGLAIKLVSIKLDKGKPQLAIVDTEVGSQAVYKLNYHSCSLNELKQQIKAMN